MDYLKAFTIGTSGPVWFQHMASLALIDDNYYNYSFKAYSLIAPIYYGLMAMFALYIGKTFNLSLSERLFITSIISICFVVLLMYFVSKKYYKPYKSYTTKEWFSYILRNGARHLINFNLIIYYFTKYFSNYWLKVFIVGSSIFSYFITYLKVILADNKNKLNYDYKTFAAAEPLIQGFDLLISLYIYQKILGYGLKDSLILWNIISSLLQLILAYNLKTYKFTDIEWIHYFIRIILTGFIKMLPIYFLLTNLK